MAKGGKKTGLNSSRRKDAGKEDEPCNGKA